MVSLASEAFVAPLEPSQSRQVSLQMTSSSRNLEKAKIKIKRRKDQKREKLTEKSDDDVRVGKKSRLARDSVDDQIDSLLIKFESE